MSGGERKRGHAALLVRCPKCNRPPGSPCLSEEGEQLSPLIVHHERAKSWLYTREVKRAQRETSAAIERNRQLTVFEFERHMENVNDPDINGALRALFNLILGEEK